jgi:hypothetical protein
MCFSVRRHAGACSAGGVKLRSLFAVTAGFVLFVALNIAGDFASRMIAPDSFDTSGNVADTGLLVATLIYPRCFSYSARSSPRVWRRGAHSGTR